MARTRVSLHACPAVMPLGIGCQVNDRYRDRKFRRSPGSLVATSRGFEHHAHVVADAKEAPPGPTGRRLILPSFQEDTEYQIDVSIAPSEGLPSASLQAAVPVESAPYPVV